MSILLQKKDKITLYNTIDAHNFVSNQFASNQFILNQFVLNLFRIESIGIDNFFLLNHKVLLCSFEVSKVYCLYVHEYKYR